MSGSRKFLRQSAQPPWGSVALQFASLCVGATQTISMSVLARNPHKGPEGEISRETGSEGEKEGPREDRGSQLTKKGWREQSASDSCSENDTVGRRRQWKDGGSAEKKVNRSQKDDCPDLLTYRSRVNQREKMSALLVACENFVRVHAHVSSQTPLFLRLELTQVRVCSFVLFFHPLGCILCGRKEMCNAPGRKPLDESVAMSSLV